MLVRYPVLSLIMAFGWSGCHHKAPCPEQRQQNQEVLSRLHKALNSRNADSLSAVVADTYMSIQPLFPERNFAGRQGVSDNWSRVYAMLADFKAELLSAEIGCQAVYSEWKWSGTLQSDSTFIMRGVMIFYPSEGQIDSARLYFDTAPR